MVVSSATTLMRPLLIVMLATACNPSRHGGADAGSSGIHAGTDASAGSADVAARRLVDAALAGKCTLTYHCGLSHPGLGSSSNAVSVDLAACTKTVTSSSGRYDQAEAPPPRTPPPPPPKTPLTPATCAALEQLVSEITDVDAREAQESAQVDTTACRLSARCPHELISVQRQSYSGVSRVEKLIVALQSAR